MTISPTMRPGKTTNSCFASAHQISLTPVKTTGRVINFLLPDLFALILPIPGLGHRYAMSIIPRVEKNILFGDRASISAWRLFHSRASPPHWDTGRGIIGRPFAQSNSWPGGAVV